MLYLCSRNTNDDTKPILFYIHGDAYLNNFADLHWKAMAEWAKFTGCGIVPKDRMPASR